MSKRKINKLKKQEAQILSLSNHYDELSDSKRQKCWSRLANIDFQLRQLNARTNLIS